MTPEFKALALGNLRFASIDAESQATNYCIETLTMLRNRMGWRGDGVYEAGSWLWKRHIATRMYEGDFRHRAMAGTLFGTSNLSLNMPQDFINVHNNRTTDDLFGGEEFFGTQPEGPEDQNPAIKLFERYLQRRARKITLKDSLSEAKKAAFIRGECFVKSTRKRMVKTEEQEVRVVLQPTNEPALDSRGNAISEIDEWIPAFNDPNSLVLQRDHAVKRPVDSKLLLSDRTFKIMVPVEQSGGSSIEIPYWADVVFDINTPTMDGSFFAHVFEMYPDDIMDSLPVSMRTPEAAQWLERKTRAGPSPGQRSDQMLDQKSRGEIDGMGFNPSPFNMAPVLVAECYVSADFDGSGKRQNNCILIDLHDKTPITYEYTRLVMPWTECRSNPFSVIRINPIEKRVYGIGYYDELRDMHEYCDKQFNRNEVEIAKSGNLLFETRSATEEGVAGLPLKFRTLQTYKKIGENNGAEPVTVVTVTPQTLEIDQTLDRTLQRMQTKYGSITPSDGESAGLDAANTATGMEILQTTSDRTLRARQAEIMVGVNFVLGEFAEIEAESLDLPFAEKVFRPMAEQEIKQAVQSNEGEAAIGVPEKTTSLVEDLKVWVEENRDNLRQRISIVMARKSAVDIIKKSEAIDATMAGWFNMPPPMQAVMKDTYAARLRALDVQNPEAMLISIAVSPDQPQTMNNDPER